MSRDVAGELQAARDAAANAWVRLSLTPEWLVVGAWLEHLRTLDIRALSTPGRSDIDRALCAGHLRAVEDMLSRPADAIRLLSRHPLTPEAPGDPYEPAPNTNLPMGR